MGVVGLSWAAGPRSPQRPNMWLPLWKWSCGEGAAVTAGTKKHMGVASIWQSRSQSPAGKAHLSAGIAGLRPWRAAQPRGDMGWWPRRLWSPSPAGPFSLGTAGRAPVLLEQRAGKGRAEGRWWLGRAALPLGAGGTGAPLPAGMLLAGGMQRTAFHQHGSAHGNFANPALCFIPTDRRLSPDEPGSGSESQLCLGGFFFSPEQTVAW